jgi:hypothetical protein
MDTHSHETPGTVPTKQLSFRVPLELWNEAEALAERLNGLPEYQGHKVSPSRVLIMAMHAGIEPLKRRADEDERAPKKRTKK